MLQPFVPCKDLSCSFRFIFSQPKLPANHKSAAIPVYSGKILIIGSNLEKLSVPYYGVLADVKKEIGKLGLFWKDQDFPRIDTCPLCTDLVTPATKPYWTFDTSNKSKDWPMLWVDFIWGSQELRWDVSAERTRLSILQVN